MKNVWDFLETSNELVPFCSGKASPLIPYLIFLK